MEAGESDTNGGADLEDRDSTAFTHRRMVPMLTLNTEAASGTRTCGFG
jgi:hypothetical protein